MGFPVTGTLAAFASEMAAAALQGEARDVLRLSLLDWCAVGLAGLQEPVSKIVAAAALADGGTAESTVFGQKQRLPARSAALVNGATSHALDYDDTHFDYIGHPSVVIFPAALAMAEKVGGGGADFLDAALIGMETACRIGRWLGMGHYNYGFHQTATAGCFGAAAAAGRLLKLDAQRMSHALGLAATRASGLKSQFGTMGKPYNAGIAAANGVEVAILAAHGFVSRPDGIECVQGFGDTHAGEAIDPEHVLADLGVVFRFPAVQHKFHACCHGTHPTLEALHDAMGNRSFASQDVVSVVLKVAPKWLRVCDIANPQTGLEAKFSYRLTTAMALAGHDTGALATFSDSHCSDPQLTALRDRVRVEGDPAVKDTAASVTIALSSGRMIEANHDLDRVLPLAGRAAKLKAKATALVGSQRSDNLQRVIKNLDSQGTDALSHLLRA
jgi:2-methylcitrate dehydratase PrpD